MKNLSNSQFMSFKIQIYCCKLNIKCNIIYPWFIWSNISNSKKKYLALHPLFIELPSHDREQIALPKKSTILKNPNSETH